MPMIRETVVTTVGADGGVHLAPLGIIADGEGFILAPFRPSTTLENLRVVPFAVANYTDDVRVFAGCLTGRRDWPVTASDKVPVARLAGALAHAELAVTRVSEDAQRPRAILVSRLDFLPRDKVEREIEYLRIAVEKTAGAAEQEAWGWLMEKIRSHYAAVAARSG